MDFPFSWRSGIYNTWGILFREWHSKTPTCSSLSMLQLKTIPWNESTWMQLEMTFSKNSTLLFHGHLKEWLIQDMEKHPWLDIFNLLMEWVNYLKKMICLSLEGSVLMSIYEFNCLPPFWNKLMDYIKFMKVGGISENLLDFFFILAFITGWEVIGSF